MVSIKKDLRSVDGDANTRNIKYDVIVPKTDNSGNKIKSRILKSYAMKMAKHFGGMTMTPTLYGCWIPDKPGQPEEIECDEVASIWSIRVDSTSQQQVLDEDFMLNIAKEVGDKLGQESTLVITDQVGNFTQFVPGQRRENLPLDIVDEKDVFDNIV